MRHLRTENQHMENIFKRLNNHSGFIFLLAGGCIVGLGPILAKTIQASSICIVLYRIMLPIPILIALKQFSKNNTATVGVSAKNKFVLFGVGIFFALDLMTFYISLKFTSVAIATLLSNLSPIFLMAWSAIKNKRIGQEIVWPLLAFIGLILLCRLKNSTSLPSLIGDGIALVSAIFFTIYILLINKLGDQHSSTDIMLWSSIGGTLFVLIICMTLNINLHIATQRDLLLLLLMSWGTQLIGQTILTSAISRFPPALSSLGILIDPVAAAFFAWLLLHEKLTFFQMIGAIVILISITFAYRLNSNNIIEDKING